MVGIKIGQVERASVDRNVRLLGRIAVDDARVYRLISAGDGWIGILPRRAARSRVEKGQRLATFYAPRFLAAQQAYFYALNTLDRFQAGGRENAEQLVLTRAQVQSAVESLRNLGMDDPQIAEIGRTRQLAQEIWITAPVDGFVLARNVAPGLRFDRGLEFYRIVDLSQIWVLVDVFESDDATLRPGTLVRVALPHRRGLVPAKVSQVLPQFDGTTRTLKVRLEADNPGFVLRPDMFVDIELPINYPSALVVPADAVVDSGVKKTVYVAKGDGVFEPRKVETGWRHGDRVEIVKGLMPGEQIVVSGTFLIDSESRMKAAAAGVYGETSTDPICGMAVDIGKVKAAGRTATYQGQTYYFCSDDCKEKFAKSPPATPGKPPRDRPRTPESAWKRPSGRKERHANRNTTSTHTLRSRAQPARPPTRAAGSEQRAAGSEGKSVGPES